MPPSPFMSTSGSSSSSRSSSSRGSSRSSRSSDPSSRKEVVTTRVVPLPKKRNRAASLSCVVWFAGGNPGTVQHVRHDDVRLVQTSRDGRPGRSSYTSESYFVNRKSSGSAYDYGKYMDDDDDDDDDYSDRRGSRSRGSSSMPRKGGMGGLSRGGANRFRNVNDSAEFGGLPHGRGGNQGYANGRGPAGGGRSGINIPLRGPNGMPQGMPHGMSTSGSNGMPMAGSRGMPGGMPHTIPGNIPRGMQTSMPRGGGGGGLRNFQGGLGDPSRPAGGPRMQMGNQRPGGPGMSPNIVNVD